MWATFKTQKGYRGGDQFESVVRHAIENWSEFAMTVRYDAGISTLPSTPVIGFLLKYEGTAVRMWNQKLQSAALKERQAARLKEIESRPKEPTIEERVAEQKRREAEEVYKPTQEEIAKTLASLKC
jgi:hypothetical protein